MLSKEKFGVISQKCLSPPLQALEKDFRGHVI